MKNALKNKFASFLIKRRNRMHLKQVELANRSDVSTNTLSDIENGKSDLKLSTICALAKGLNMTLSEFFEGFEDGRAYTSSSLEELIKLIYCEKKETIDEISKIVKTYLEIEHSKSKMK